MEPLMPFSAHIMPQIRRKILFGIFLSEWVSTYFVFLFLHEKICCEYSLDAPLQGTSNEYPNHERKKNTPFLVEKVSYEELCNHAAKQSLAF